MAIIRVEKNKNYTCMSNYHLRDKRLSNKAKGLMSIMLSLPEDWDYSVNGLTKICKDGRDSIISQLKELEDYGYLLRTRNRQPNGQMAEIIYNLFEEPYGKPVTENPTLVFPTQENPTQGKPTQGNPIQINTNRINTNRINTKELNKDEINTDIWQDKPAPKKGFVPPTRTEVFNYVSEKIAEGCNEYKGIDVDKFYNYYNEADWHMSNGKKVRSWKQCLVTWAGRQQNYQTKKQETPTERVNRMLADIMNEAADERT